MCVFHMGNKYESLRIGKCEKIFNHFCKNLCIKEFFESVKKIILIHFNLKKFRFFFHLLLE